MTEFGDRKQVLQKLAAVDRAASLGDLSRAATLALDAQDALTWGVAMGHVTVAEFQTARRRLTRALRAR